MRDADESQGSIGFRALGVGFALEHEPVIKPWLVGLDEHRAGLGGYAFDMVNTGNGVEGGRGEDARLRKNVGEIL